MVPYTKKLSALDVIQAKIFTLESISPHLHVWQFKGNSIVFTNGCFDIIIVGINSDASVKRQGKSSSRPLQDEQTRAMIMASFHFVSAVIIFDEDTPLELIKGIMPEVLVKGADYDANETNKESKKYIVGSDVVKANKGEVRTIEFLEGFSTTAIEQKIKNG
jgi:rfaE bifunctional protein nucleotidyltransferase chain/domain